MWNIEGRELEKKKKMTGNGRWDGLVVRCGYNAGGKG